MRQSKQRLLEQIQQIHRFQEWDRDQDPELHGYGSEWPSQLPFYNPELDPRNHKPSGLQPPSAACLWFAGKKSKRTHMMSKTNKLFFFFNHQIISEKILQRFSEVTDGKH